MITEDRISFETAKLLKEKGFDLPVNYVYHYWTKTPFFHRKIKNFNSEEYRNLKNEWYSAPTQSLAMKWLREVKHIPIEILWHYDSNSDVEEWYFIHHAELRILPNDIEYYETYEEAAEAAIKYCLKNLI